MPVKGAVNKAQAKPRTRRSAKAETIPVQVTVYRTIDDGNPNDPQSEREFITTEALPLPEGWSIEEWLQRTAGPGRYRAEYRAAHGRVVEVDKILIGAVQQQGIADNGAPETGLELLDEDEFSNDPVTNLRIRNAKLSAKLEAISQNGAHGSIGELLQGLRALDEMRGQSAPQKSLAAQLREMQEINAMINPPRRETNPAPSPQPIDPEASVFQMLARDDEFVDKITGGIIGKIIRGESSKEDVSYAEVLMKAVETGQAAQMVNSLMSGLQGIVSMILPPKTQPQTTPAHPDLRAQVTPAIQPAQPPAPADVQQPSQALPANNQTSQAAPEIAATGDTYTAMLTDVITALMKNDPVDGAIKRVDGFLLVYPAYTEVVSNQFSQDAGTLLGAIATIPGCEQIAQAPHAKQWLEQFQARFFNEEGEETGEDSPAEEQS